MHVHHFLEIGEAGDGFKAGTEQTYLVSRQCKEHYHRSLVHRKRFLLVLQVSLLRERIQVFPAKCSWLWKLPKDEYQHASEVSQTEEELPGWGQKSIGLHLHKGGLTQDKVYLGKRYSFKTTLRAGFLWHPVRWGGLSSHSGGRHIPENEYLAILQVSNTLEHDFDSKLYVPKAYQRDGSKSVTTLEVFFFCF